VTLHCSSAETSAADPTKKQSLTLASLIVDCGMRIVDPHFLWISLCTKIILLLRMQDLRHLWSELPIFWA